MKSLSQVFLVALVVLLFKSCSNRYQVDEVELIPVSDGKLYQYIDRHGKVVISPQFKYATVFRDGLALVQSPGDDKYGFIDKSGTYKIAPKYKDASVFSEGLAWVVAENGAPTAISTEGEIQFTLKEAHKVENFSEFLAAFSIYTENGSKSGYVNNKGQVVIAPQFAYCGEFHEGFAQVKNSDEKWGYINKEGVLIINYQFDRAFEFVNQKAIVVINDKYGVINTNGEYVINPQYESLESDGDKFIFEQGGKWGLCDGEGKVLINPQFEDAGKFNGMALAPVRLNKKWGFINQEGKIVVNPQFDFAYSFNGNLAAVGQGSKYGFVDNQGVYVINPQFDYLSLDYILSLSGLSLNDFVNTDYFDPNHY